MKGLYEEIHQRLATQPLKDQLIPLFCQTLRWGHAHFSPLPSLKVGPPVSAELQAEPVAQLSGLPVYCILWPHNKLPGTTARRAVHQALKTRHAEHLLCYLTQDQKELAFVWARPRADGRTELRTLTYEVGSPARTTIEQLGKLAFRLDELGPTGNPPITAVTDKLDAAFNIEKVTTAFFEDYKAVFAQLQNYLFEATGDKTWAHDYALQLLNRLMFLYFIQRKGWLGQRRDFIAHFWRAYKSA
jgi:hypothetical protein